MVATMEIIFFCNSGGLRNNFVSSCSCYSYTFSIVTVFSFENLVCSHKLEDNGRQSKAKKRTTVNIKTFLGKNILMDMK